MTWQKLVEREGDFLKNCLLYESFEQNFQKVFQRNHGNFLTIRKGNTFIHYLDKESAKEISKFMKEQLEKNPLFMKEASEKGKYYMQHLLQFAEQIQQMKLQSMTRSEMKESIEEYFTLYKQPYPYFNLTVFSDELEKDPETIHLMAELRLYTRTSFNKVHELINPLFIETAKRLDLAVEELKFLTPKEILNLFERKDAKVQEKIKARQNCYFLYQDGRYNLFENTLLNIHEEKAMEIQGRGTFPGRYLGRSKLIHEEGDVRKLNKGDVLVTRMTTPPIIMAGIQNAGAIITDEGGITCHAAIISRELGIPALIGTSIATQILTDNDLVEIDFTQGKARKIS